MAKEVADEEPAGDPKADTTAAAGDAADSAEAPSVELAARTSAGTLDAPQAEAGNEAGSVGMFSGVFVVGAGVVVAFVLLFGMTFLVLRPR